MKNVSLLLFVFGSLIACPAFGSRMLDERYAFRATTAVVINDDKQAIYGQEVEKELAKLLKDSGRFEYSDQAFVTAKQMLKMIERPKRLSYVTRDTLKFLVPVLQQLRSSGTDSIFIAEVQDMTEGSARVALSLVNTADTYVAHSAYAEVTEKKSLNSYLTATRLAFTELVEHLPFDANVVVRDGYRVVLDQGWRMFRKGMRVSAYTLETLPDDTISFVETGSILITHAEEKLSFGRVMVEKRPREVGAANKVRAQKIDVVTSPALTRSLASEVPLTLATSVEDIGIRKAQYGTFEASLVPTAASVTHTLASGGTLSGKTLFIMSMAIRGELYLTNSVFTEASLRLGRGPMSPITSTGEGESVGTQMTDLRFLVGYRYGFNAPARGFSVYAKGGLKAQKFSFGSPTTPLFFTDNGFNGFLVAGGARLPITSEYGFELDLNTLLLRSFSEGPVASGAQVGSVASWEMSLRYYHRIDHDWDFNARALLAGNRAEFTGTGTRTQAVTSIDHSFQALFFGATYYF